MEDRKACERWIRSDPSNALAFQSVAGASFAVDRALQSDSRLQQLAERAYVESKVASNEMPLHSNRRPFRPQLALAASVVLAALAVWVVGYNTDVATSTVTAEVFQAPETSSRQVALSDGSNVYIDAGASISANLSSRERRIVVIHGRALFEVAHDSQRPFIVSANNTKTVALGTQFEVEKSDSQTTITLVEGSVAVTGFENEVDSPGQVVGSRSIWSEQLKPGNQLRVAIGEAGRSRADVDTDGVISWSRGWLVFQGVRLVDAVAEINRYSNKKITLAEDALGELTIAGSFMAGESESIANAVAEILPLRVVDAGSREIILFKRYED